mmetsp:Transcript_6168/g.16751  ORF Transcript_6168/g.16751 Transcript_6168/m.16751 type:complete len:365 (-) Transcript_6168:795-1889(-)
MACSGSQRVGVRLGQVRAPLLTRGRRTRRARGWRARRHRRARAGPCAPWRRAPRRSPCSSPPWSSSVLPSRLQAPRAELWLARPPTQLTSAALRTRKELPPCLPTPSPRPSPPGSTSPAGRGPSRCRGFAVQLSQPRAPTPTPLSAGPLPSTWTCTRRRPQLGTPGWRRARGPRSCTSTAAASSWATAARLCGPSCPCCAGAMRSCPWTISSLSMAGLRRTWWRTCGRSRAGWRARRQRRSAWTGSASSSSARARVGTLPRSVPASSLARTKQELGGWRGVGHLRPQPRRPRRATGAPAQARRARTARAAAPGAVRPGAPVHVVVAARRLHVVAVQAQTLASQAPLGASLHLPEEGARHRGPWS